MYRSASRYESSRSISEKPSRSVRSTWVEPQQNRPYVTALEDDDRGILGNPYLAEDAHVLDTRDYQQKMGSNTGGTDFREAQRLAANFFSQYPSASTAPEPGYRDAPRLTRPFSPEIPVDRYPPRGDQSRDRDVGVDRWSGHPKPEPSYPSSSRSQLVLEDWEEEKVDSRRERDLYAVAPARGRKMDNVGSWDDTDYDYGVGRKESECPPIQTAAELDGGGLRVTKRLDWTGLLRPDGNRAGAPIEDGLGLDMRLKQRGAPSQTYRGGGRPYLDSYHRDGLEDELNSDGSRRGGGNYSTGQRYRQLDLHKDQSLRGDYVDEPRHPERNDFLLGRSLGSGSRGAGEKRGGRGGREGWRMDHRETVAGQGQQRAFDSERGKDKRRFDDKDARGRPFFASSRGGHFGGGSGTGADRGWDLPNDSSNQYGKSYVGRYGAPKRDFSQRASITNQDILAVYYGNQGPGRQPNKFSAPTRGYPYSSGPYRQYTQTRRPQPLRSSRSPLHGRPGLQNLDLDPSRRGQKRWEKPAVDGVEGKRFKRETQSDKLYLMHNSKAKSEEKEQEAPAGTLSVVAECEVEEIKEGNNSAEVAEPAVEDTERTVNSPVLGSDPPESINGSWRNSNNDSWSDSEEEEKQAQMTSDGPSTNDVCGSVEPTSEEQEYGTLQAMQSGAEGNSQKFLGERSEDGEDNEDGEDGEDDDADWESLASDLDDQLDDVCVHQGAQGLDVISENPDRKGVEPLTNSTAQASETNEGVGVRSVEESQDSEMVDIDNIERSEEGTKEASKVPSSLKEGSGAIEKKKIGVIMEELQENVKNREDNAFEYYVSLFEQDTDLMKLYEANVTCGSFECLVCAGVRAKKKKRFPDVASLVQHAKKILRTKKLPEHRGFARAVCKILGWETVPGPSVILPRSSVRPQQSDLPAIPVPVPTEEVNLRAQGGDEGNAVELEKEWAAARQLFEEQEARIEITTKSSGALLQNDNSATSWLPSSIDRKNPDTALGPDGFMPVVEKTSIFAKSIGNAVSVQGRASPTARAVEFVSHSARLSAVRPGSSLETSAAEAFSVLENGDVAEALSPVQLTVVEAAAVPDKTAAGETHSVTENSPIPGSSLTFEIATVAPARDDLERSSSEVKMWSPLPPEEKDEDDLFQFSVVAAKSNE